MNLGFKLYLRGFCMAWLVSTSVQAMTATSAEQIVVTAPATTPFDMVVSLDKTGTAIADIPRSIQIVPRALFQQQGATQLRDTLRNVSGLTEGGQFAFGFYDRFSIRGLNVSYLNDGLPDSTSGLGGFVRSLNGVERVEVLKGPGSALYGSSEAGGTINLVHARPSDTTGAAISEQFGSYGTTTTDVSLTGPTGISNLDYRVDGEYRHSNGFRDMRAENAEIEGALAFRPDGHDIQLRLEYRHIENRPDSIGIPFSPPAGTGLPLAVPRDTLYYSPFAFANQDIKRAFLSDAWSVNDMLTVNLRSSYTDRDVDLARNAGGRITLLSGTYGLSGRQIRAQSDSIHDFVIQAEPTWRFSTGPLQHVLVTGAEARRIDATTSRRTADLPNIANILAPMVRETSLTAQTFLCNATHSCNDADLDARFYGIYAIDQVAIGETLKIRVSGRENWFRTSAEGRSIIPVNPGSEHPCSPPRAVTCAFVPGAPVTRKDTLFSWDVGAVYFIAPQLSVFGGYADAVYPVFNTEEPQSVGQTPERGRQLEAGLRFQSDALTVSTSLFRATRTNVYTILLVPDPAGTGNIDIAQVFSYRTKGIEADVNLRPTRRWNIIANITLQNPELTDYPQSPALVGNRVPSVPSRMANLWTTYDFAVPTIETLQLSLGARYRNREYGDAAMTRDLPYTLSIDAAVAIPHDRWTFRAGVSNIFDHLNYAYAAGAGSGAFPDNGRTFFTSLGFKI